MFTRRTATVTISAPDASCARTITGYDGYLPVPTMRREVKVRSAMTSGSITGISLAAADEVHDLHFVPFLDARGVVSSALDDDLVVLDSDAARIDAQLREQGGDGERTGELKRLAIQTNRQPGVERTSRMQLSQSAAFGPIAPAL